MYMIISTDVSQADLAKSIFVWNFSEIARHMCVW